MEIQDIQALVTEISEYHKKQKKEAKWRPTYELEVEMAERIAVHAELGKFPLKLFQNKAPNEDGKQWDYRKQNYRAFTMPYWNRAINAFSRIWNENNYEIKWPNKEDQKEYFTEKYPSFKSIISYFETIVTRLKVNDPNSVLVVRPHHLPMTINTEGEIIFDDTQAIEAVAHIHHAKCVIKYEPEVYLLAETCEKSIVEWQGNKRAKEGMVYELYDTEAIYRIVQVGKKVDWQFTIELYYQHNLGYLPAWRLQGLPLYCDDVLYYKSCLYDAVPLLDEALYDASTLQISKVGAAFPVRWAITESCDHHENGVGCNGTGKISYYEEGKDHPSEKQCPACKGSGRKNPFTPMGLMEVKAPENNLDTQSIPTPPFGIVEPSLNTLTFLDDSFDKQVVRAFLIQNIDVSADVASGKETATGKLIDREELFSFLTNFSSELFDLLGNTIKAIGEMRYAKAFEMPSISKPVNFSIHSEKDLTEELAEAQKNGLPEAAIRRLMREYMSLRFTDTEKDLKILDLAMEVDSLFAMPTMDIIAGVGAGYIQKWEAELHKNINSFISEFIEANEAWLDLTLSEKREQLVKKAKDIAAAASSAFDPNKIIDGV